MIFNIDRTKNIITDTVFNTINQCNKEQLEKWLKELNYELKHFEKYSTRRQYVLLKEKELIKYKLGL